MYGCVSTLQIKERPGLWRSLRIPAYGIRLIVTVRGERPYPLLKSDLFAQEQRRPSLVRFVIAWIFEQMALFQIKPEDLGPRRGPKKHSGPVAAKYRDPQSGATWSGRGRAPHWLVDQDREKFLIAD